MSLKCESASEQVVMTEVERVKTHGFHEDEMRRAKANLVSDLEVSNPLFKPPDLHWSSPESGDLQCTPRVSKTMI